jgi:hypothetical protein
MSRILISQSSARIWKPDEFDGHGLNKGETR